MKVKDLKPSDYNPGKITEKKLSMLGKSMKKFGDLSGDGNKNGAGVSQHRPHQGGRVERGTKKPRPHFISSGVRLTLNEKDIPAWQNDRTAPILIIALEVINGSGDWASVFMLPMRVCRS